MEEQVGTTPEAEDPWSLPELTDTGVPWSGKSY